MEMAYKNYQKTSGNLCKVKRVFRMLESVIIFNNGQIKVLTTLTGVL